MSRVPLGKVLLRNVIRHTDAHNKIQEESEMWKIREMEKQSQEIRWGKHERALLNSSRATSGSKSGSPAFGKNANFSEKIFSSAKVVNLVPWFMKLDVCEITGVGVGSVVDLVSDSSSC
ncbi:hypothetical protein Chor_005702 [Crotalus horridus]